LLNIAVNLLAGAMMVKLLRCKARKHEVRAERRNGASLRCGAGRG
jgi:hypothetical protein